MRKKTFNPLNIFYKSIYYLIIPLLLIFSPPCISAASSASVPAIKHIEITGNQKISTETIQSRMKSRVGSDFSKTVVQDDIKNLYTFGYFDDIKVDIETFEGGVKLVFTLVEKPTITSIDFQGNSEFENDALKEKISITSGAVANLSLITDNVQKLITFYQSEGYWHARVFPIIRENQDNAVALTFQIDEGSKVKIGKVTIEGNQALPENKIRKVIKTKKWWLFSFLTGSGTFKKEQIREDTAKIRELYNNNGYIYAGVSKPEITLSEDKKKLFVKIIISEGEQYSVGSLTITDNTIFSDDELFKQVETESGKVFNRGALKSDIDKIVDMYMEKGYARADINPVIKVNSKNKTADITFSVTEGNIFSIGRIYIEGNTKTRDKVIRREMRLDEGETFNKKLIKRSYQRINNLNFFESVDLAPAPRTDKDLIDINIDVKEKTTGTLSVGGGYSSIDKFVFMSEVSQSNLFGKGLYLKFKVDLSSKRSNYRVSLTNPWFLDKPVSASVSVFNESYNYTDYDKESSGGSLGLGKELSEYVGGKIVYTFEDVNISDVSDNASSYIQDRDGRSITSSISPSIWRDTRDNYLDPTTGSRNALYTTIAGLGGDNNFFILETDSILYTPATKNTTFSIRGRYGYATGYNGSSLPIYERFYVGGINTVRGLSYGEGGPISDEGEKIGGNRKLIFNAEYIVPIVKDINLKGLIFFDYGAAFNDTISIDEMRYTTGFGIRWLSPLGPIRLEWGFNLDPKESENNDKIEFSLGGFF